jgi:hypothetical protein
MPPRLFTLDEALALLPTVRQLMLEIQALKREVDEGSEALDRLLAMAGGNGHLESGIAVARKTLEAAVARLQQRLDELDGLGVEIKGIDEGLADFRSEREGRVVYLCWRLGEDTIAYWHELDTGFAGRRPL